MKKNYFVTLLVESFPSLQFLQEAAVLSGLWQSQASPPFLHSGQLLNAQRDLIKDVSKAIKGGKLEIFCSQNRKILLIFNAFHCDRAGLRQFFLFLSLSCVICNQETDLPVPQEDSRSERTQHMHC